MTTVERAIRASQIRVFDTLADPTTYPDWLVGAKEIRAVDPGWPAPGTRFHHRVGLVPPLEVDDHSISLEVDAPDLLALEVRARPLGRGRVDFHLRSEGGQTVVRFDEVPIGPAKVLAPVLAPLTAARNRKSLDQLAELLEP